MQTAIRRNTSYNIDKPVGAYITNTTIAVQNSKKHEHNWKQIYCLLQNKEITNISEYFLGGKAF